MTLVPVTYKGGGRPCRVFSIDPLTGKRLREIPTETDGDDITFELDGTNPTIYYEMEMTSDSNR